MTLPKEFCDELPRKSDAELYAILEDQEDYLPEAIEAAKEELSKRNLQPEEVDQLKAAIHSEKAAAESKATEPLGWGMRALIFLFCAGLGGAFLALYYEYKGFKRKSTDCWMTMGISLGIHLLLGVIAYSFQRYR